MRELLRQAAGRHGCTFEELLADGAQTALGAETSLDLPQVWLKEDTREYPDCNKAETAPLRSCWRTAPRRRHHLRLPQVQ